MNTLVSKEYDVIIIGSGPAGLSSALYTARAGFSTAIISGETEGGLVTTTQHVDNYLGFKNIEGMELAQSFLSHAQSFENVSFISDKAIDILDDEGNSSFSVTLLGGDKISSKALIYSAGSLPRRLDVPNGDSSAISYCANCDGAFYSGKKVILVGGGETAFEDALYLSSIAEKVTVLVRNEISASRPLKERVESLSNVEIRKGVRVEEIAISRKNNGFFTSEVIDSIRLSSSEVMSDIDGLFVAIGQEPCSELISKYAKIHRSGFAKEAHVEGLFLAGDICNEDYRQIAVAVGSGAKAGIDTVRYLMNR